MANRLQPVSQAQPDASASGQPGVSSYANLKTSSHCNNRERVELLGSAAARIMESVPAQGFTPDEITAHKTGIFREEIIRNQAVAI